MFSSNRASPQARRALAAATIGLLSASCDPAATATGGQIGSIQITPAALALNTGAERLLSATVLDEAGSTIGGAQVHWSAQHPLIATVSPLGVVTAVAPGKTQVAASKGGKSAVAPVTVSAPPPALIRVTPTTSTVLVGSAATLTADVMDAGGGILTGHVISWSSTTPAVATVNAGGIVTGVAAGNVAITARAAGLSGTAVVTVRPVPVATVSVAPSTGTVAVGQSLQLTVSLLDAAGRPLTGRPVTWASGDVNTATVSSAGLVRARKVGTTTITTTSEGKTGTATITVP